MIAYLAFTCLICFCFNTLFYGLGQLSVERYEDAVEQINGLQVFLNRTDDLKLTAYEYGYLKMIAFTATGNKKKSYIFVIVNFYVKNDFFRFTQYSQGSASAVFTPTIMQRNI